MGPTRRARLPLVGEYGPSRIAFCTDDRDPEDIADNGHVNGMVRDAVAAGIDPADAIVMASFHPALWHRLTQHGALAPGYVADLLLLPDLEQFAPELVPKRGKRIEAPQPAPRPAGASPGAGGARESRTPRRSPGGSVRRFGCSRCRRRISQCRGTAGGRGR